MRGGGEMERVGDHSMLHYIYIMYICRYHKETHQTLFLKGKEEGAGLR
jgi:hypothetical protein